MLKSKVSLHCFGSCSAPAHFLGNSLFDSLQLFGVFDDLQCELRRNHDNAIHVSQNQIAGINLHGRPGFTRWYEDGARWSRAPWYAVTVDG